MTVVISRWGNSQGLRTPKDIMRQLHLSVGNTMNIVIENKKIILEPIKQTRIKFNINDLVKQLPSDYKTMNKILGIIDSIIQ